jgi:hypothetical protein
MRDVSYWPNCEVGRCPSYVRDADHNGRSSSGNLYYFKSAFSAFCPALVILYLVAVPVQ